MAGGDTGANPAGGDATSGSGGSSSGSGGTSGTGTAGEATAGSGDGPTGCEGTKLDCDGSGSCATDGATDKDHCGDCDTQCAQRCRAGSCADPVQVSVGLSHACALLSDGSVWCWGSNFSGELGPGHPDGATSPILVALPQKATAVAAGGFKPEQGNPQAMSCALLEDKTAVCWGANAAGELGNGLVASSAMPVQVKGVTNITELSLGGGQGCAVTGGGKLHCWGRNDAGQVGNAKMANTPTPVSVLTSATHVSCGEQHTCALTSNSDLYCWGSSDSGRLGIKPLPQATNAPLIVPGMNDTDEVSAGANHTCGRRGTQISCWGGDYSGAVNGTFSNVETPVTVNINGNPPASKRVVVGNGMSSSVGTDDIVTVWGALFHGDGQGATGYDPAKLGVGKVLDISLGKAFNSQSTVCVIKLDHSVACWGSDTYGQVGNGDPVADTKAPATLQFME